MVRSIQEIKKTMTDRFMTDETLRTAYGITGEDATWDTTFSTVSIENILLYIVAVCAYGLEVMFDQLRKDVDAQISQAIVASVAWYHRICLAFQYGDNLVYLPETATYGYQTVNEKLQIVQYAAVRDLGGSVQVLVSKDSGGKPEPLNESELAAFESYLNKMKIAGITMSIKSIPADKIIINMSVQIDPLVIDTSGNRISDGKAVVVDAINNYLAAIVYGGTFNKTKLVDAVQAVEGVLDVTLGTVKAKSAEAVQYTEVKNNNYTSVGGAFISEGLNSSITYVV
ncbi:hypothetical protein [uncultured Bacteroides sp.]|jgi:hypothetical protein|uniref:hypothetical protein n=1 Tax=uncultured Bacteroides sp. TaxID=162156 RepID=UPI00205CAC9B|nr:hypothetical protein [uncultured Bacteroides sp.]DAI68455.1 MAG TPA: Baseplate structural protein [Caudoviricetes sp.]